MCKYEMDPASIVEDTERTWFCPQTDGQTDGQTEGWRETSIPPFQLRWSGGYHQMWCNPTGYGKNWPVPNHNKTQKALTFSIHHMSRTKINGVYFLDCFTVPAWWHYDCQWNMRHGLPNGWHHPFVIGWSKYQLRLPDCGLMWPVGISTVFQRSLTVPLHSPNGRQMPAVRAVQGDCERF